MNNHIGDTFDSFLAEQGILSECSEVALKRVLSGISMRDIRAQPYTAELAKELGLGGVPWDM